MKNFWLSALLLTAAIGCGQNNPPPVANDSPAADPTAAVSNEPLPEGVVLVTLKLPEMT